MIENDSDLKLDCRRGEYAPARDSGLPALHANPEGRVRFPRGYIGSASSHRRQLGVFISKSLLKKNLSYNLMLSDIYRWLLDRTDLAAVAAGMVVKAGVVLSGSICESLVRDATPSIGGRGEFGRRVDHLTGREAISRDLKAELDWLWTERNKVHVVGVEHSELDHYQRDPFVRSTAAVKQLIDALGREARAAANKRLQLTSNSALRLTRVAFRR